MLHVATTVVRLERPLHNPLLLGLFGNASRCPHVSQAIPKYSHPYPQVKTDGVFSHFDTLRDTPQISLIIGGIPTIHGQKLSTNYMFVIHNPVISTRDTVDNLSKPE